MYRVWIAVIFFILFINAGCGDNLFNYELYETVIDDELCARHLDAMNSFEFYDASFRVPQGLLTGNWIQFGNYHQCLKIRQDSENDGVIEGKHCMFDLPVGQNVIQIPSLPDLAWPEVNISLPRQYNSLIKRIRSDLNSVKLHNGIGRVGTDGSMSWLELSLGVCIPKSCSLRQALAPYFNRTLISVDYTEQHCRLPGDKPFVPGDYVAIVVFTLIALVTLVSTGYELHHIFIKNELKPPNELWCCCSLYRNTKTLFTFSNARGSSGMLNCLDGIRSLSILWVIVGHTLLLLMVNNVTNFLEVYEWFPNEGILIASGNISVDSFFMMSGLLLVYTAVPKLTQKTLFTNIHLFYLNRLLRMFPILATATLLQASLFHHMGDGANWKVEAGLVQYCRQDWWAALLHIQNYYNPQMECLPHTWYLAVDVQLHIISPLILVWALGTRRMAWIGLLTALLASITASTIFCFTVVANNPDKFFELFYVNTLTRAPVFVIGMVFGYVLHIYRRQKLRLPKILVAVLWILSISIQAGVIYMFYLEYKADFNSELFDNLSNSFRRPLWALSLGWLIIACVHGYGGIINWFLSLTIWKFVARISYAMYLFHYPMQFLRSSAIVGPIYFSATNLMLWFINDVAITVMLSIAACVIIDAPMGTIIKRVLTGPQKKQQQKKVEVTEAPPEIVSTKEDNSFNRKL